MTAERAGVISHMTLRVPDYQRDQLYQAGIVEYRELDNSNVYANSYSNAIYHVTYQNSNTLEDVLSVVYPSSLLGNFRSTAF